MVLVLVLLMMMFDFFLYPGPRLIFEWTFPLSWRDQQPVIYNGDLSLFLSVSRDMTSMLPSLSEGLRTKIRLFDGERL